MKKTSFFLAALACAALGMQLPSSQASVQVPEPMVDLKLSPTPGSASIVLAGGCFWGVQGVFQHVRGVTKAVSGYAGGTEETAHYNRVSQGDTGHAESVLVTYDPSQVTLGKLLQIYFAVAHDPTQLNYQGPDHGTQYRSAVFYATLEQKKIAEAYIHQLQENKVFGQPVVTTVEKLEKFYPAEPSHQDFMKLHPDHPYIVANDLPKVEELKLDFANWYVN